MSDPADRRALPLLLVLTAGAFAQVAAASVIWDDVAMVFGAPLAELRLDALRRPFGWLGGPEEGPYWRPLTTATFLVDHALGAQVPLVHLHALAWHLLGVALAYTLARVALSPRSAVVAAGIFALHPMQGEAVAWLCARADLVVAALLAGAALLHARGRPWLGLPLVLGASLAKESAWLAPLLVPAVLLGLRRPVGHADLLSPAAGVGIALLARAFVSVGVVAEAGAPFDPAVAVGATAFSLAWLVLPWPLTSVVHLPGYAPGPAQLVAALLAVGGLAVVTRRPGPLAPGWLLLGAAVAWAPTLPAVSATGFAAERYLYLPLLFLGLAVGGALESAARFPTRWVAVAAAVALVVLQARLPEWRDEGRFFGAAVTRSPSSRALFHHAGVIERGGDAKRAFGLYLSAARAPDAGPLPCVAAVVSLRKIGAWKEAAALSDELADNCGAFPRFRDTRLRALLQAGRVDDARRLATGDVPLDVQAALCTLDGNATCVIDARSRAMSAETLDDAVEALLHPR